jgi:hypothetical protein
MSPTHMKMKKLKQYKNFIIAEGEDNYLHIFTKDEWSMGKGYRYPEHEAGSMEEAIDFIDSY